MMVQLVQKYNLKNPYQNIAKPPQNVKFVFTREIFSASNL